MDEPRRDGLAVFAASLGHGFATLPPGRRALSFPPTSTSTPRTVLPANERLELPGHAVLELCVTRLLYFRCPEASEGELSKARSGVVNETRLASLPGSLAWAISAPGAGRGAAERARQALAPADALEATLAAVYLDAGLEAADAIGAAALRPPGGPAIQRATEKATRPGPELVQDGPPRDPPRPAPGIQRPGPRQDLPGGDPPGRGAPHRGVGKSKKEAELAGRPRGLLVLAQRGIPPSSRLAAPRRPRRPRRPAQARRPRSSSTACSGVSASGCRAGPS